MTGFPKLFFFHFFATNMLQACITPPRLCKNHDFIVGAMTMVRAGGPWDCDSSSASHVFCSADIGATSCHDKLAKDVAVNNQVV